MQTQCKILAIGVSQFVNRIMGTQEPLLPLACPRPSLQPLKEVIVVSATVDGTWSTVPGCATTPPPSPESLKKPHFV